MDSHEKPWDTDFMVQPRNETYKNCAKIIQKFTVRSGGVVTSSPPPSPNTPLIIIIIWPRNWKTTDIRMELHMLCKQRCVSRGLQLMADCWVQGLSIQLNAAISDCRKDDLKWFQGILSLSQAQVCYRDTVLGPRGKEGEGKDWPAEHNAEFPPSFCRATSSVPLAPGSNEVTSIVAPGF